MIACYCCYWWCWWLMLMLNLKSQISNLWPHFNSFYTEFILFLAFSSSLALHFFFLFIFYYVSFYHESTKQLNEWVIAVWTITTTKKKNDSWWFRIQHKKSSWLLNYLFWLRTRLRSIEEWGRFWVWSSSNKRNETMFF